MHIVITECIIPCTRAVPVSLICSQLFGVKTYSCVSLFCVVLLNQFDTQSHPLPNTLIYWQKKFMIINMQGCSIIPALPYCHPEH